MNIKVLNSLKSFDWRALKKYLNPSAIDDLNAFLEKLPQHTNQSLLIITGIVWATAGAVGLFATVQTQKMTELRAELQETEALIPIVPRIADVPVNPAAVQEFVKKISPIYTGLEIKASGPQIVILAQSTNQFGQFREAIGHVQNGGSGWRVNVDKLCVGRECDRYPLAAALKINKVSVDKPG